MIEKEMIEKEVNSKHEQVRIVNVPRKVHSGENKGKYELDIVPIDFKEDGKIIEGDMKTIIVPEDVITEMMRQAKGLFGDKEKEGENQKVMYG